MPFIEITDDDVNDLNNGSEEDDIASDEFSTNPGFYVFYFTYFFFYIILFVYFV